MLLGQVVPLVGNLDYKGNLSILDKCANLALFDYSRVAKLEYDCPPHARSTLELEPILYPRAILMARATIITTIAKDMVLSTPITSLTRFEYGIASVGENAVAAVSDTYT